MPAIAGIFIFRRRKASMLARVDSKARACLRESGLRPCRRIPPSPPEYKMPATAGIFIFRRRKASMLAWVDSKARACLIYRHSCVGRNPASFIFTPLDSSPRPKHSRAGSFEGMTFNSSQWCMVVRDFLLLFDRRASLASRSLSRLLPDYLPFKFAIRNSFSQPHSKPPIRLRFILAVRH